MEEAASSSKLQEEILCSICQNCLRDPVTVKCRHNFCTSCIHTSWQGPLDEFPCPICHQPHQKTCISANPQLGRLVDLAQILQGSRSGQKARKEVSRCEEHNQVLTLFCEDDQGCLCPLCAQHPAHQGHHVRSVEEAASCLRHSLSGWIKLLKEQMAQAQKLAVSQDRKMLQVREEGRRLKSQLDLEYEHLRDIVEWEQEAAVARMQEEEKHLQQQLSLNLKACSARVSALKGLIREVAERSSMSEEMMMMRDVRSLEQRCERLTLQPPAVQPLLFKQASFSLPPMCSKLRAVIQKFWEPVSLDPQTAHPYLRVSEDEKSVVYEGKTNKDGQARLCVDTTRLVVLGREVFASGRHYWEVQVGDKTSWAVGLCSDTTGSKSQWPKRCWTVQLQDGDYLAVGSVVVPLVLKDNPTVIGVYLDYDLGQVSFYDARDRTPLHSFTETFAQVLKPFFCIGHDSKPLTICSRSWRMNSVA